MWARKPTSKIPSTRDRVKENEIMISRLNTEDEGPEVFLAHEKSSDGLHGDNTADASVEKYGDDVEKTRVVDFGDDKTGSSVQKYDVTSPGPNLEQKVPSVLPELEATASLVSQCALDCGVGRCSNDAPGGGSQRCRCPLGYQGPGCKPVSRIDTARFYGQSWVGFAPLKEAYRDVQITIEFKPEGNSPTETSQAGALQTDRRLTLNGKRLSMLKHLRLSYSPDNIEGFQGSDIQNPNENFIGHGPDQVNETQKLENSMINEKESLRRETLRGQDPETQVSPGAHNGVLLVSGENDDLTGDFMAAVIINGYVEFRWDCGSGAGVVRSADPVRVGQWNRLSVYRHRWDVLLQLNDGQHVQGRSEGLFSRITFREPLYVGGSYNVTSHQDRLGVTEGFRGCVRKLQVNDQLYQFYKATADNHQPAEYRAVDGWDISE
ncbi:hypothetical protein HAZT_HAZT001919 [Hyalella azteca]|uniref:EGF-like domain-containing protein n=1 Tax=Hyalella azteca TaxID=294128 RepID=A0A6A0GXH7_HYAAZ|nr:hypothetical protein HAZT_HAZT001919 [Hyalella azteca]